jgi:ABC-type antimicrobial peptide transport system permease subunit
MISYMVNERTRELGIRIALGADSRAISYLVLERGARLLLPGLALGIAGAWALTRLLGGYLYETSAYDPIAYGAALTLLTLVGLFACLLPARRATRIDPVVALKHE